MPKVRYNGIISDVSGKQEGLVFASTANGPIFRARVIPTNPNTTAQQVARRNFSTATIGYSKLPTQTVQQWEEYAATLRHTDPVTGKVYTPAPGTVFTGLASSFLLVNPSGTVPQTPPTGGFAGDTVTVNVVTTPGTITWVGSHANAAAVQTILLVQKLPSTNRKPGKENYRLKGFIGFQTGNLSLETPVAPGRYALAYKFVQGLTGQTSPLVRLGTVDVT